MIIVATTIDSDIPVNSNKEFIEKIVFTHLNKKDRLDVLTWFLSYKNIKYFLDLEKISKYCSGFTWQDLQALVFYAIKTHKKKKSLDDNFILTSDDFMIAYGNNC